ncbi:hypothetical protein Q5741_14320 [Paenibacillus sp. JX-17]|uniref:Restriction endonuclease n=1 Tax=Paenibacillus lacisoli TaxID=3064525 RepID=A0ABT9CE97_9BACL|nr:hypothetical protein [Paenibacillus sp. JX-17]MDO7907581.1 hypothetical protein [Paenibacillus sp. JX-17]
MNKDVVTLYEDRTQQCAFTSEERKDLMSLKTIWGTQNLTLHADDRLLLKHYVGFISTPNLRLQVLPKIFHESLSQDSPEQEVEVSSHLLLRLLQYSSFLSVRELPSPQFMRQLDYDILELFIHLFLDRFLNLYERHVHRSYEDKENNQQFIKGKILFQQSSRRNYGLRHTHMVAYQEFTEDTLLNQIFKSVMLILGPKIKSVSNKKKLAQALMYLEDVSRIKLSNEAFKRVKFNRMNRMYKPVFNLARMFYSNIQPGLYGGDDQVFTFLVPLNKLFEAFVYQLLERGLSRHSIDVHYQKQAYLDQEHNQFLVKPDYMISTAAEHNALLIGDAKYKDPVYKGQVKPSEADLYQMLVYAMRFKSNKLFLFYPRFIRNEFTSESLNRFQIDAGEEIVHLFILEIDLLETDLNKMEQAVGESVISIINE